MPEPERSVLHVLPHTGGGGDTYVDLLEQMSAYRVRRVYVAPTRKPNVAEVAAGLVDLLRTLRGYDILHVHGEATAALFLPLLAAKPSVVTLHGLHLLRRVTGLTRRAAELNLRAVLRAASRTICVSDTEREELVSVVGPVAAHRSLVVHNGAYIATQADEPARTAVRAEFGLDGSRPVAIWVGSLDERRDPLVVIRAALRTSTQLLMVGEGPLREEARRAARAPVHVIGHRKDIPALLAAADFFVLMSEREGLSFALLEAMAHGLPAIVADVPENRETIGETGIAVPYADEAALVAALRRLSEDADERVALGERARTRVAERFDARTMLERTRAVYDDVLAGRSV